jgi:hypothetical protein
MMIVPDPLPLFTRMTRLGALVAVAGVTLWWVRKRRPNGSRSNRQSTATSTRTQGTLKRLDTKPAKEAPGRAMRNETRRPAKEAVRA